MASGQITREELLDAIRQETIETVLVAMPDWYGRLLGKRLRRGNVVYATLSTLLVNHLS